jgi:hypothetical protein
MSSVSRPSLYRSLTFWSGLLAILFTLWAWQDSVRNWSTLTSGPFSITSRNCGLTIFHSASPAPVRLQIFRNENIISRMDRRFGELDTLRFGRPDFGGHLEMETRRELNRTGMLDGHRRDPVLHYFYSVPEDIPPGEWLLFIPYWCVLLTLMAFWLGLIYWRYRRMRGGPALDESPAGEVEFLSPG